MPEQAVVDRVLSSVVIPTIPKIVQRLTKLLHKRDAGMNEVAAELAHDPALSAQVLRIANSAYYGLEEPVLDIARAATYLGMRTLYEVVLRASILRTFEGVSDGGFPIEALWKHSILTGQLAQWLTTQSNLRLDLGPSDLYTCGLLHDLGRLVLLSAHREQYEEVLRLARSAKVDSAAIETERFGFSHTQAGAVLACIWQLPQPLQDSIEFHHGPERYLQANATAAIVALADHVARGVEPGSRLAPESLATHPACKLAGLPPQALEELVHQAEVEYRQIEV